MQNFNVGDRVRIKELKDLLKKYGAVHTPDINAIATPILFYYWSTPICGQLATIKSFVRWTGYVGVTLSNIENEEYSKLADGVIFPIEALELYEEENK